MSRTATLVHGCRWLRGIALALLGILPLFSACSDDDTVSNPRCGNLVCNSDETPSECPIDCSYTCVPDTSRCVGNTLVTCLEDGLHESQADCQPGQYCSDTGCQQAPDAGGTPDAGDGDGGDL